MCFWLNAYSYSRACPIPVNSVTHYDLSCLRLTRRNHLLVVFQKSQIWGVMCVTFLAKMCLLWKGILSNTQTKKVTLRYLWKAIQNGWKSQMPQEIARWRKAPSMHNLWSQIKWEKDSLKTHMLVHNGENHILAINVSTNVELLHSWRYTLTKHTTAKTY